MEHLPNPESISRYLARSYDGVLNNVLTLGTLLELGVILIAASLAWLIAKPQNKDLQQLRERHAGYPLIKTLWQVLAGVSLPLVWLLLQWTAVAARNLKSAASSCPPKTVPSRRCMTQPNRTWFLAATTTTSTAACSSATTRPGRRPGRDRRVLGTARGAVGTLLLGSGGRSRHLHGRHRLTH